MDIRRAYTIFLRQLFLFKKSKYRLFGLFYWSTIDLLLWGVLTLYLTGAGGGRLNFITVILGSVILLNFFTRVHHGISISYLEDVWVRNFMNLFASPLSINEYMLGLMLTSLFQTVVSMVFMIAMAWLLFTYNIFQFGLLLMPFVAILFLFGWTLGIFTTSIILRLGPSSEIMAWSVPTLLTPLAGVFYPVSALPGFIQPVARLLPISYVFEGMRSVVLLGTYNSEDLWWAICLALVLFAGAYWFLLSTYKYVLRQGHFTKFFSD